MSTNKKIKQKKEIKHKYIYCYIIFYIMHFSIEKNYKYLIKI